MRVACPFSTPDYLQGLANLGAVERHPVHPVAVLKRSVPGTRLQDGLGPWPYRWIGGPEDLDLLREGFRHLVTLTVVSQPGWTPGALSGSEARPLKDHFVFDPRRPAREFSRRTRRRLRQAERMGAFEAVTRGADRLAIADLYEHLKVRRNLLGGFFDMPRSHFAAVAALPGSVFYRVDGPRGVGAMACGLVLGDFLQVLHVVTTEAGLRWNASYLLMKGLQEEARKRDLRLLTGGVPDGGSTGLRTFKERWANAYLPVQLLCFVNDGAAYRALTGGRRDRPAYFPAYRDAVVA